MLAIFEKNTSRRIIVTHSPLSYTQHDLKSINMIKKWFGERCLELRTQLGLSQEKFALKIGMDRTYYASVEAGKRNLSIENIEKIVNGFEISLHDFFNC